MIVPLANYTAAQSLERVGNIWEAFCVHGKFCLSLLARIFDILSPGGQGMSKTWLFVIVMGLGFAVSALTESAAMASKNPKAGSPSFSFDGSGGGGSSSRGFRQEMLVDLSAHYVR